MTTTLPRIYIAGRDEPLAADLAIEPRRQGPTHALRVERMEGAFPAAPTLRFETRPLEYF